MIRLRLIPNIPQDASPASRDLAEGAGARRGFAEKEFQKASARPSPERSFWEVGSSGGALALVVPPGRMLKKTASIVLASLRGSTY